MADSGSWYGTTGEGHGGGWGRERAYTQGLSRRHADQAHKVKRHALVKTKRKAARRARKANRG